MSKEEIWRIPAVWILTGLGTAFGYHLTQVYNPLIEKIDRLEQLVHAADKERVEMRSDIKYLKERK